MFKLMLFWKMFFWKKKKTQDSFQTANYICLRCYFSNVEFISSLVSLVKVLYKNLLTFFAVHVAREQAHHWATRASGEKQRNPAGRSLVKRCQDCDRPTQLPLFSSPARLHRSTLHSRLRLARLWSNMSLLVVRFTKLIFAVTGRYLLNVFVATSLQLL